APQGRAVLLSAEDSIDDTVCPRLLAAGADMKQIAAVAAVTGPDGARRTFDLAADLAGLEQSVKENGGARLVIIDPITTDMGRIDSHRVTDVRRVLEPLSDFAERNAVAVIAIVHPNKMPSKRALHAIGGSGAFGAAPRLVLYVGKEPDTERAL